MNELQRVPLSEYILKPKEERTRHIDLCEPCHTPRRTNWRNLRSKALGLLIERTGTYNNVENRYTSGIFLCHLCRNGSQSSSPCTNPSHLYFGTPKENLNDLTPEILCRKSVLGQEAGKRCHTEQKGIWNPDRGVTVTEQASIGGSASRDQQKGVHDPKNKSRCIEGNVRGGTTCAQQRWISLIDGFISSAANISRRNRTLGGDGTERVLLEETDAATLMPLGSGRWRVKSGRVRAVYEESAVR